MNHNEAKIQVEIVKFLWSRGFYVFSIPNEAAGSNAIRQGQMITMGLRPGVADLCVLLPGKVVFLEVKTATGKQSEHQKKFESRCIELGHEYHVVRSVEDVERIMPI